MKNYKHEIRPAVLSTRAHQDLVEEVDKELAAAAESDADEEKDMASLLQSNKCCKGKTCKGDK